MTLASSDRDKEATGLEANFNPIREKSAPHRLHKQDLPSADADPGTETVLKEGMSNKPESLGSQAMPLNKMAEAIRPIISTFDSIMVSSADSTDHERILTIHCSLNHTSSTTMRYLPVLLQS